MIKKKTVAEKKKIKRERIVESAISLLAEKGFRRTKMTDIAQRAGVADGTIYSYFRNKDDLMMKALYEVLMNKLEEIKKIVAQEDNARAKIVRFFDMHATIFTDNPHIAKFLVMEIKQIKEFYEQYPSYSIFDNYREFMKEIYLEGVKSGYFRDVSADAFSLTVIGAMDFVLTQWVLKGHSFSLNKAVFRIINLIHNGSGLKVD